ncbi:hypothetical protein VE23_12340 [Paenibacillus sp. D9]|nr:hypothetical protein VE23_12340 [Paenibacillus sp. D9]
MALAKVRPVRLRLLKKPLVPYSLLFRDDKMNPTISIYREAIRLNVFIFAALIVLILGVISIDSQLRLLNSKWDRWQKEQRRSKEDT